MADNKTIMDNDNKKLAAGDEEYEVRYIAEKLGVSEKRVREAIHVVGNDRQKVEDYLKGNK